MRVEDGLTNLTNLTNGLLNGLLSGLADSAAHCVKTDLQGRKLWKSLWKFGGLDREIAGNLVGNFDLLSFTAEHYIWGSS